MKFPLSLLLQKDKCCFTVVNFLAFSRLKRYNVLPTEPYEKASSSLAVVHGRRRVGKSRLIEEFGKRYRFLQFAGLPPTTETTAQDQRDKFAKQLADQTKIPFVKTEDWDDLFSFLARETKKGRVVILFDEISWMGSKDHLFLGKLKDAWDTKFKTNPQLILILCGSVSSWVEKNILRSTGFMGRISLTLFLRELQLFECNELLDEIGFRGSDRDRFKILSITVGIPRYLEEIKPNLTAEMNIQKLCFRSDAILFREFNDIFSDLFSKRSETYKQIVTSLVAESKSITEIAEEIKLSLTGYLSQNGYKQYHQLHISRQTLSINPCGGSTYAT